MMANNSKIIVDLDTLISHIKDGCRLAIPTDFNGMYSGAAVSATRALIRRGVRDLHIIGVPTGGLQADMLIGAGCVKRMEAGSMFLGEFGVPPAYARALKAGKIEMRDSTCPAIHAGLQAGEKGIPFIPLRGILGSDVVSYRNDWKVIDNPFGENDPILLVAAITPDVMLMHAPMADRHGNIWIGRRRELAVAAHASAVTLVTVEKIVDTDFMADEQAVTGVLSNLYVTAVSHQPKGAWPLSFGNDYDEDAEHLRLYVESARTEEGFKAYLDRYVFEREVVPA
jgi:glutaconate CoA-transferase subunit A